MAVLIDLDPFYPKPVVIQVRGTDHHLDAGLLTTDLVLEIDRAQRAMAAAEALPLDDPATPAAAQDASDLWGEVVDRVGALLEDECKPPLVVRSLPPAALGVLVGSLYAAAMGKLDDQGDDADPPPSTPRRRGTSTTSSSRSSSGGGPARRR